MPRSFHFIIVAVSSFLLEASAPHRFHHHKINTSSRTTQSHQAVTKFQITSALIKDEGSHTLCIGAKGKELSCESLSAQSSVEQARYSGYQALSSVIQTVIIFSALIAAGIAAYWAKEAAIHTKSGVDEAKRNADVADRAGFNGLRPWLNVEISDSKIFAITSNEFSASIILSIKNEGRMPALNTGVSCNAYLHASLELEPPNAPAISGDMRPIFSGRDMPFSLSIQFTKEALTNLKRSNTNIGVIVVFDVRVSYECPGYRYPAESSFRCVLKPTPINTKWIDDEVIAGENIYQFMFFRRPSDEVMT